MKIEEIRTAELETIEQRAAEIAEASGAACDAELTAFAEELEAIEERKAATKQEAAEKRAAIEAVKQAAVVEEPTQEERQMTNMEIRFNNAENTAMVDTDINFDSMISLFLTGSVMTVSNVPLSRSPAVASIAG